MLARIGAKRVVCLGDSFHDDDGPARLCARDAAVLKTLTGRHEWIWIAGNHDPAPPAGLGGEATERLTCGAIVLRRRAKPAGAEFELSGHFHPKAHVKLRARRLTARCFVSDGRRLILPAFGAYAGGLNVLDPAIDSLFPNGFRAHVIGPKSIHRFDRRALLPGPAPIADTE